MGISVSRVCAAQREHDPIPTKEDFERALGEILQLKSRLPEASEDYALAEALEEVLSEEVESDKELDEIGRELSELLAQQVAVGGQNQVRKFLAHGAIQVSTLKRRQPA